MKPFTIPASARKALLLEPHCMVIYGNPGLGKTPIALALGQADPNSVVLADTHQGALHYNGRVFDICAQAQESGDAKWRIYLEACRQVRLMPQVKFFVVDHAAHLADWADQMAIDLFKETPIGKSWPNKDETGAVISKGFDALSIIELPGPKGSAGWGHLWSAFQRICEAAYLGAHYRTIFIGHPMQRIAFANAANAQDAAANLKQDDLASAAELDLGGPKMKKDFCSVMDAIGYMQRSWEGNRVDVSFKAKDAFTRTRCEHLEGRKLWFSNPCPLHEWARIYPQTLHEYLLPEDKAWFEPLLAKYGEPVAANGGAA